MQARAEHLWNRMKPHYEVLAREGAASDAQVAFFLGYSLHRFDDGAMSQGELGSLVRELTERARVRRETRRNEWALALSSVAICAASLLLI